MRYKYEVDTFVPKISGCMGQDNGWDGERCEQFREFLNLKAGSGWRLHSCEYRDTSVSNGLFGKSKGVCLVCVFEKVVD